MEQPDIRGPARPKEGGANQRTSPGLRFHGALWLWVAQSKAERGDGGHCVRLVRTGLGSAGHECFPSEEAALRTLEASPVQEGYGVFRLSANPVQDPGNLGQASRERSRPSGCGPRAITFSRARLCQSRRFIGDWNPQRTLKAKRDLLLDGEFICYELRNLPNICSRRSFAVGLTGVSRPSEPFVRHRSDVGTTDHHSLSLPFRSTRPAASVWQQPGDEFAGERPPSPVHFLRPSG